MKKLTSLLLVVILSLTLANQPAFAWNAHGHRVIASIAFMRLEPYRQLEIANRIRKHPRWDQDFAAKMPEVVKDGDEQVQAEWIFQQAAVWPDMPRGFRGEDRKKYHHPTWHYINKIAYLNDEDKEAIGPIQLNLESKPPKKQAENMNVIQAIEFAKLRIDGTVKVSPEEEALMWCWYFHCYADLHQPLHTTALFSKTLLPKGCRGGNSIKTKQSGNLHSLWNGLLGNDNKFQACHNQAEKMFDEAFLKSDLSILTLESGRTSEARIMFSGMRREYQMLPNHVASESHHCCKRMVYTLEIRSHLERLEDAGETEVAKIDLSEAYLKQAGNVAKNQASKAGWRLGELLK